MQIINVLAFIKQVSVNKIKVIYLEDHMSYRMLQLCVPANSYVHTTFSGGILSQLNNSETRHLL